MTQKQHDEIRNKVRDSYAEVAEANNNGDSCGVTASCCGVPEGVINMQSVRMGYSEDDINSVPQGADMGLGCGNPQAIASLKAGEVVIDLGAGGGFDCFLAGREVGNSGHVIGIDMTPTMISKARNNAEQGGYKQVEFRLGEIEHLPVPDNTADVIISNCVINLSPNKPQVFKDAFRALKSGGRLAISDVVAQCELPDHIKNDLQMYSGCMAGASPVEELRIMMEAAGFCDINITPKNDSKDFIKEWAPDSKVEDYVVSANIEAVKP